MAMILDCIPALDAVGYMIREMENLKDPRVEAIKDAGANAINKLISNSKPNKTSLSPRESYINGLTASWNYIEDNHRDLYVRLLNGEFSREQNI